MTWWGVDIHDTLELQPINLSTYHLEKSITESIADHLIMPYNLLKRLPFCFIMKINRNKQTLTWGSNQKKSPETEVQLCSKLVRRVWLGGVLNEKKILLWSIRFCASLHYTLNNDNMLRTFFFSLYFIFHILWPTLRTRKIV